MKIGAQFYTLHNECQTLEGFEDALKKVADIGYKYVQISGTCEYEAQWLSDKLKENGLECVLTHIAGDKLANLENIPKIAADHTVFSCDRIGLGWFNFDEADENHKYDEFLKLYKPVAKEIKANGKYMMFHNHAKEFQKLDGKVILEKMAEDFSPDELGFTLDTYWVQVGGGDPAQWIERLSGRLPCIHLKDCAYDKVMSVVGEGNINFDRVFEKAEGAGVKYMLVEQDDCNGENPFDCLKRSYDYLKSMGF